MDLHPLINELSLDAVKRDSNFYTYFTGARFRKGVREILPRFGLLAEEAVPDETLTFNDLGFQPEQECFEFIPIFEALEAASGAFCMVDLGAGYGLWSIHAACLARRKGLPFHLAAVEAEPRHFELLRQAMADNGISEDWLDLHEAAIDKEGGLGSSGEALVPFLVSQPSGGAPGDQALWFGQATGAGAKMFCGNAKKTNLVYYGNDVYETEDGWQFIQRPVVSLRSILERCKRVDLLVMDIQGSELAVVKSCSDMLSGHVGRVAIGTHGADMESGLRDIFTALGWEKILDFTHSTTAPTHMGDIFFRDGLLYFRNPAFAGTRPNPAFFLPPIPEDISGADGSESEDGCVGVIPLWAKSDEDLATLWRHCFYGQDIGQENFRIEDGVCLMKPATDLDYIELPRFEISDETNEAGTFRFEFTFPGGMRGSVHWYVRVSDEKYNPLGDFTLRRVNADEGKPFTLGQSVAVAGQNNALRMVFCPLDGDVWHVLPVGVAVGYAPHRG